MTLINSNNNVFAGFDSIIDRHLGLISPAKYRTKTAIRLCASCPAGFQADAMLSEMLQHLKTNWPGYPYSKEYSPELWRWQKQLKMDPDNALEKRLEKDIVKITSDDWVNQVPAASGLFGNDRKRSIDLMHRVKPDEYEFIELKVYRTNSAGRSNSNTPLMAAMEMMQYAILYLFARGNFSAKLPNQTLMSVTTIHLQVLADAAYYNDWRKEHHFCWFESELTAGLKQFVPSCVPSLDMDFRFMQFPSNFSLPYNDQQLQTALGGISRAC